MAKHIFGGLQTLATLINHWCHSRQVAELTKKTIAGQVADMRQIGDVQFLPKMKVDVVERGQCAALVGSTLHKTAWTANPHQYRQKQPIDRQVPADGLLGGCKDNQNYGLNVTWHQYSKNLVVGGGLFCPSQPRITASTQWTDYVINAGLSGSYVNGNSSGNGWVRKQTCLVNPGIAIFVGDSKTEYSRSTARNTCEFGYRHGAPDTRTDTSSQYGSGQSPQGYYYLKGKCNQVYMDGHVSAKSIQELPSSTNNAAACTSTDPSVCGFHRNQGVFLGE